MKNRVILTSELMNNSEIEVPDELLKHLSDGVVVNNIRSDIMDVGKRIKELREKAGCTVNKLVNLVGISQSYLRDIELGNKNPTVETLSYFCDVLNVSLKDFFDEENRKIEPTLMTAVSALNEEQ